MVLPQNVCCAAGEVVVSMLQQQAAIFSRFEHPYFSGIPGQPADPCDLGKMGGVRIFENPAFGTRYRKEEFKIFAAVKSHFDWITAPSLGFRENRKVCNLDLCTDSACGTYAGKIHREAVAQVHHAVDQAALSQPHSRLTTRLRALVAYGSLPSVHGIADGYIRSEAA